MKKFFLFSMAVILLAACNNSGNNLPQLTGISLNKAKLSLEVGDTYKLNVYYEPEEAETGAPEITWESSKESVASVNANGKVTANKQGKTTITAYCGKLYAECSVEVTAAGVVTDPEIDPEIDPKPEPEPTYGIENGAITKAVFQVSSAGKKVRFSQGNLQYQASTGTWRFAEYQCDMIGDDNSKISDSYSGWIDLFGWGTGGNPTLSSYVNTDYSTFTDWGVNKITNGGNTANQWRTLTADEWEYIITNGNELNNEVEILDSKSKTYKVCRMLLPSDFITPAGVDMSSKMFSDTQWLQLQENGAVFLPAAGNRDVKKVSNVNINGYYSSSTPYEEYKMKDFYFSSYYNIAIMGENERSLGCSVRLVQDLK